MADDARTLLAPSVHMGCATPHAHFQFLLALSQTAPDYDSPYFRGYSPIITQCGLTMEY